MKPHHTRSRAFALAASLTAMILAFGLSGAPAQAASSDTTAKQAITYVGLGDSYAAGTGGGPEAPPCYQSAAAYPTLLGGTNLGCFGATTTDVALVATNNAALLGSATDVSLTVGGNDVGTGAVTAACVPDPLSTACASAVANTQIGLAVLPGRVANLVAYLRSLAPTADIVVTGYPRLFTVTSTMPPQQQILAATFNAMADALNAAIAAGTRVSGARFVDVTQRFLDHGIGSDKPWINFDGNLLNPDNFHPNAAGYNNGYRTAVNAALKR